ncbi:MAG: uracil-DNA glycosylase family protein [Promethearchaeota archaeon]
MSEKERIESFYKKVMTCENSLQNCPCSFKSKACPPRSFFYNKPNDILVVGINPGKMKREFERKKFENANQEEIVKVQLEIVDTYFKERLEKQSGFHYYLLEAMKIVCDRNYNQYNFTNIVKCQTVYPWSKLSIEIRQQLLESCFRKHFINELKLLKPKLIFVYGKGIFDFINSNVPNKVINLPRIGQNKGSKSIAQWKSKCLNLKSYLNNMKLLEAP